MAFRIEYSPDAVEHLAVLPVRTREIVLDAVERQLQHQPTIETRNRKPMRPNPIAPWELRVRNLRVYYDVVAGTDPVVQVRAVGVKERSQIRIGGEVVEL